MYWLLTNAVELPRDAERAKAVLRKIAIALQGDLAAAEPARVLRVPGSRNFKYAPPAEVRLIASNRDHACLEDFEESLVSIRDPRENAPLPGASAPRSEWWCWCCRRLMFTNPGRRGRGNAPVPRPRQ